MKKVYKTNSVEETQKLGQDLAQDLKPGDVVALNGDLGAGKTAFTQGLAKGLGVEDYVTSPTFTIMNVFEGRHSLYHFDVYRIGSLDEMDAIGFDEFLYGDGIVVIEWAYLIGDLIPDNAIRVDILKEDFNTRRIEITRE